MGFESVTTNFLIPKRQQLMVAAKVEHADLPQHSLGILQQFREFWMENHLCDVVLKSNDSAEHRAHSAVLSAASKFFKNLLGGSFLEADRVQKGQPVEIAASKAAVSALLDYIYGGQPEVNLEAGLELLRLAEAYDLPNLAGAIEAGFRASLDSSAALKILQEVQGLHDLKATCEEKVAADFETCSQQQDFWKLSAGQLARILKREDLVVSREEAVLKCIFNWLKISKDRNAFLAMLLQLVDFQSVSVDNLLRLGSFNLSSPNVDELHREVHEALRVRRKRNQSPQNFRPKRRCLQHWSPDLGASTEAPERMVFPTSCNSLCWHEGAIYATYVTDLEGVVICWKPGDLTAMRRVAGKGTAVTGINDLGCDCSMAISPTGEIFVTDYDKNRIVSFQHGSGHLVLDNLHGYDMMCCSPNGVLYVLMGKALQKLQGSRLQTVMTFESLPEDLDFSEAAMFATKEEVIYIIDRPNHRILRVNPAESLKPVVVRQVPVEHKLDLWDLFVTEGGTVYVAEQSQRKVLAFHPGCTTYTEVLQCPGALKPIALLVQGKSLYVSTEGHPPDPLSGVPAVPEGVYEFLLPPELQLE